MNTAPNRPRVVYLLGAGASHACVKASGSAYGILMTDLGDELAASLRALVVERYATKPSIQTLVNDVISAETDFEHIITFLDESSSALHKLFAADLRRVFETVLRKRLADIYQEQKRVPDDLYFALVDMHSVPDFPEELNGFLTLNYDEYLENAIQRSSSHTLDAGIYLDPSSATVGNTKVVKLHGSFGWAETWPITLSSRGADTLSSGGDAPSSSRDTLWIPPGIQKRKERYPFNVLWGLAREILNCDILRVIGCRLGPNDWDLISLLFSTRHTHAAQRSYRIEIIDSPAQAKRLQATYPYLDVQSLLEVETIGKSLVGELTSGEPRDYHTLTPPEQDRIDAIEGQNWFRLWLKHKAEAEFVVLGSLNTPDGAFQKLLTEL